jgi:hypothetical protein
VFFTPCDKFKLMIFEMRNAPCSHKLGLCDPTPICTLYWKPQMEVCNTFWTLKATKQHWRNKKKMNISHKMLEKNACFLTLLGKPYLLYLVHFEWSKKKQKCTKLNHSLSSKSNQAKSKDLKLQTLTLPNQILLQKLPNPIFFAHFEQSS